MGVIQIIDNAIHVCNEKLLNWILLVTIVLFLTFNISFFLLQKSFEMFMTVNSLFIAFIAVIITLIIASNQQSQLDKLEEIGRQTKETTRELDAQAKNQKIQLDELQKIEIRTQETADALETQSKTRQLVEAFFNIKDSKGKPYQLFFPAHQLSKPLPLINEGDFYAVHVVSTRLGEERIENKPIIFSEYESSEYDINQIGINPIFFCSPEANPALKRIFDFQVMSDVKSKAKISSVIPEDLPCWFVNENENRPDSEGSPKPRKKIWVSSHPTDLIGSPAEEIYIEAASCKENKIKFEHPLEPRKDLGILARLHKDDRQLFIIAGIHQYGTWIIAHLLSQLFYGKSVPCEKIFLGEQDFIAVIWGIFDFSRLTVTEIGIYENCLWVKKDNEWIRQKEKT